MNVRWLTKAVFLTLVLAVYSASVLPQQRYVEASESAARLRFGKSIALSDFDSDGLIDQASLHSSSLHKSVRVLLSRTGKLLNFRLDNRAGHYGSLFAQDVDNDGATDLIWTDLIHANHVVVWLGDGAGHFARVPSYTYTSGFTLEDANVASRDESTHETAINTENDHPLDQLLVRNFVDSVATLLPNQRPDFVTDLSSALGRPSERGPPLAAS